MSQSAPKRGLEPETLGVRQPRPKYDTIGLKSSTQRGYHPNSRWVAGWHDQNPGEGHAPRGKSGPAAMVRRFAVEFPYHPGLGRVVGRRAGERGSQSPVVATPKGV